MTLEEAIKHCEEVAKENDDSAKEFYRVSKLETHNSITKGQMLKAMNWMWEQIFELKQDGEK